MDLNLDTLKREILDYLESSGFAVFRSSPGALEGLPMVLWDVERHPDYQQFLEVARKSDIKLILFAAREFEASDLDELMEQVGECELSRDEERDYERRLRDLRVHDGVTCSIELAFDYNSRLYVYSMQPDWYEEFIKVDDEISSQLVGDEDLDDHDSFGYFSKN